MFAFNVFMIAVLIAATAFFVAVEFAIVKIRPSRVDQLVQEKRRNALAVKKVTENLDGYLGACQLGITITALGLGWLGDPTVEAMLRPILLDLQLPSTIASVISFISAFLLITCLHVVLGELAPKTVAIQKAESIALLTARPIIFFYNIMYPFIWILNGSALKLVGLFGINPASEHEEAHSEEELQIILSDSYESGMINKTEYGYVSRIFTFDDLLAREIMVPRTDMVCLYLDKSLDENMRTIKEERYTRFPVVQHNKDHIVGMINTKRLFLHREDHQQFELDDLVQPVLTITESIPVKHLLKKMQQEHIHLAILVDEYGGTSGMITIEDILEEIVGDIRDEFDSEEKAEIEQINDNHLIVDGIVSLTHINNLLGTNLEGDGLDTIGGWLNGLNTELQKDTAWQYQNLTFIIREKEKHRIRKLEIMKHEETEETTEEDIANQN